MNGSNVKENDKIEINDFNIFVLCISSGAIGFSLIGILPNEIPLFLRVLIALLFLGIPLLDIKQIVLFGMAGGLGFFIKDFIFWDLFSFKWTSAYGNTADISLLTGIMIGTFLGIALWNRKAIVIFPLTGVLAFSGFPGFIFSFFLYLISQISSTFISIDFASFGNSNLEAGIVFASGMCLYLLSIRKTPSQLRKILLIFGILLLSLFGIVFLIGHIFTMGHPPYVGNTVVSIGEVGEKEGTRIAITDYTFLQNETRKVLKAGIIIQSPVDVNSLRLHLWYRQDEYLGREITELSVGNLEKVGQNTTNYTISFENLPDHLRTEDHAVVWEIWTRRGIEYVIWRTK